jgi:hypothetical protein
MHGSKGVENASVFCNGMYSFSDSSGTVTIDSVISGKYKYTITADGYKEVTDSLIIEDADKTIEVIMKKTNLTGNPFVEKIKIFPNPISSEQFNLQVEGLNAIMKIELRDILGEIVFCNEELHQGNIVINAANLERGMYFIYVSGDFGIAFAGKVIKK